MSNYAKEYHQKYRINNKLKFRKYQKKYADKNREYYQRKNKEQYQKNKESGYHNQKQQEYAKKYPERIKARNKVTNNHLRDIECQKCGRKKNLEGHHPDYSKPAQIVTLCKKCHNEISK